jgi:hypothetical protein
MGLAKIEASIEVVGLLDGVLDVPFDTGDRLECGHAPLGPGLLNDQVEPLPENLAVFIHRMLIHSMRVGLF